MLYGDGGGGCRPGGLNGIPFLVIRAISDKADGSASVDYPEFESKAIAHTVALVKAMIKKLEL